MAEGDQVAAALGRQDRGDAGCAEDFTLGDGFVGDGADGGGLEGDEAFGDGAAVGHGLVGDVHHAGAAGGVEMG